MQFIRHWQSLQANALPTPGNASSPRSPLRDTALTIGNFDGVHLGHQSLLRTLVQEAKTRALVPTVMSFSPHPAEFFDALCTQDNPTQHAPERIQTLRDKVACFRDAGIERLVLCPFDAQLAHMRAQDFIAQLLVQVLGVKCLLIGDDFRFGAKRAGDLALLQTLAKSYGYSVMAMPSVLLGGMRVSSSAIRRALANDDMALATRMLGHPYVISGHVVHGAKLGRSLDAPTINIRFGHPRPAITGIFAVTVEGLCDHPLPGVASLGTRPSLAPNDPNKGQVLLEVHLLSAPPSLNAYGRIASVFLRQKLHEERKYPSLHLLKAGIAADIAQAHEFFATHPLSDDSASASRPFP